MVEGPRQLTAGGERGGEQTDEKGRIGMDLMSASGRKSDHAMG